MLIKLMPDQVIKEWEVIKYSIRESTYEQVFSTEEKVRNHLREILVGTMQVWAITEDGRLMGIVTTRFSHDATMGVRRLEIYSLYSFKQVDIRMWVTCFVVLKRFAKAKGCHFIIALSDQEGIIKLAERIGGDASQHLLVFSL